MDSTQADLAGNKSSSLTGVLSLLARWPSYLVFTALLLWVCWYDRLPSLSWDALTLYFLWIAFLGLWLPVRIVVWLSERPHAGAKRQLGRANRPAFDRLAREALSPPSSSGFNVAISGEAISRTDDRARSIGVYEIERVEYKQIGSNNPEEVFIYLAPFHHHEGFVYCPRGRPDDPSLGINLGGGWYTFAEYSA